MSKPSASTHATNTTTATTTDDDYDEIISSCSSIKDEIEIVKKRLPKIQLQTTTNDFVTAIYEKTFYRKIKTTLTFPKNANDDDNNDNDNGYPNTPLIVSISSVSSTTSIKNNNNNKNSTTATTMIPPGLQRKLEKELTQKAKEYQGNYGQIFIVLQTLQIFMDTNRFVPCWKELKQMVDWTKTTAMTISISSMNETKGLIKLKWNHPTLKYHCNFSITIDEGYPTTLSIHDWGKACSFQTISTNVPLPIQQIISKHVQTFVRHLQDGMPEELAVRQQQQITTVTDTQSPTTTTNDNNNDNWKVQETERLASYEIPIYDGSNPQPSLFPLVRFLNDTLFQGLFQAHCPICQDLTFPTDPQILASMYTTSTTTNNKSKQKPLTKQQQQQQLKRYRSRRPMQPSCGCWYHYECLNTFLTEPPFGEQCPFPGHQCHDHDDNKKNGQNNNDKGRNVTHPDWATLDRKELERAWETKQARQREMDDVAMMF